MGEIIRYHCTCGYDVELCVGSGLNARNKNIIQCIFGEDELRDFLSADKAKGLESYELRNELAICKECKKLVTVPCLHYKIDREHSYDIYGGCPHCKTKVESILKIEEVLCPYCEEKMEIEKVGYWD